MTTGHWYIFERPGSRRTCPACGRHRQFTQYVDAVTHKPYADHVGRCNREHNCGYNFTPIDFRNDGGHVPFHRRDDGPAWVEPPQLPGYRAAWQELVDTMPDPHVNTFLSYLKTVFRPELVEAVADAYMVGTWSTRGDYFGAPVFWQVDAEGEVHGGKVRQYDAHGHGTITSWHHFLAHGLNGERMQEAGIRFDQCMFGLHLVPEHPEARIGIVEAEKTAIVARIAMPEVLWIAAGSRNGLTVEKLLPLKGRRVLVVPDVDGMARWSDVMDDASVLFPEAITSTMVERIATQADAMADIADMILDGRIQVDPGVFLNGGPPSPRTENQ
jgi:hypothetical protein